MADYKNIIPFIRAAEGGLSRATTDTASSNPSPCRHDRVMGWHTNKGVTWTTFKSSASLLGYSASCSNFITMPDSIWNKIFKYQYWDKYNLDLSKSQAIANVIVTWAFGSGVTGAYKQLAKFVNTKYNANFSETSTSENRKNIMLYLNQKADQIGERKVFDELVEWRKNYFISLNQSANLKGWLSRLDKFYKLHTDLATKSAAFVKRNWLPITLGTAATIAIIIYAVKNRKNG